MQTHHLLKNLVLTDNLVIILVYYHRERVRKEPDTGAMTGPNARASVGFDR
jgi:hypothetical protein